MQLKIVILILLALLSACTSVPAQTPLASPTSIPQLKILSLGDSYTFGQGVPETERYPVKLAAALSQNGIPVASPHIIARSGWTTDDLLNALQSAALTPPYQLVTVLIGVNDQYGRRSPEDYRLRFRTILQKAVQLAGGQPQHVLVFSIPDWGATPFGEAQNPARVQREINQFNTVNREEVEQAGARYLDITPLSRTASSDGSMVAADGLHYSGKMYTEWASLALPVVLEILSP